MPLRRRLTIALTVAVAVVVALACVAAYLAVRDELMNQVDDQLTAQVAMPRPRGYRFGPLPDRRGGPTPYIQLVDADGTVATFGSEDAHLPVDAKTRAVAAGSGEQYCSTVHMKSAHVRILTAPLPDRPGIALQVGRSLDSIDKVLKR